jgi:hypothetical protein
MNKNPYTVLDSAAGLRIPDDLDLFPQVKARLTQRRTFMQTLRARPALAIVLAVLALILLSGVAYAIGRSLGYIPGVGIVSQEAPLRLLAEPVTLTKDGITVKVEEATLSADKTVVRFRLEGLPTAGSQDITKCDPQWGGLKLPDGAVLRTIGGYGLDGWDSGFEARFTFEPVPADLSEATFIPPCLQHYLPGALPEEWGLSLHFIPAPSDITVAPVVEITPSPETASTNPMTLEKVIETEQGYILVGKFQSTGLPPNTAAVNFPTWFRITDANGQEIPYTLPNNELGLPLENLEKGAFSWAVELDTKSFSGPLTISSELLGVEYEDAQAQFEFDSGPNPQDGQVWDHLNIDFELAGHPIHVNNVIRTPEGYQFSFESQDATMFQGASLAMGDSLPGMTGMDSPSSFMSEVKYAGEIPAGKLTVVVTQPVINMPGLWQIQWKPDKAASPQSP